MQYALYNGNRTEAKKGLKGSCISCGKPVFAKCGKIKMHHWAHESLKDCDSWYETETQWHRDWKNQFPEDEREIPNFDHTSGEIHRADVQTKNDVTIEFQNSPITPEEFEAREKFYSKLIWVVNGLKFISSFEIGIQIPNPEDPLLDEFNFIKSKHLLFQKKSDILSSEDLCLLYSIGRNELKDIKLSIKHYYFEWKNPRNVWLKSKAIVLIDFGDDFLYWLKSRNQIGEPIHYLQIIKKTSFLRKYSALHK